MPKPASILSTTWTPQWTSGPWYVSPESVYPSIKTSGFQNSRGRDMRVAYIMDSLKESRANAHLISAAPDMYEALDALFDLHCRARLDSGDYIKEFQAAHDALAKARGES